MNSLTGQIRESSHVVFAERVIPQRSSDLIFANESDLIFEDLDVFVAGGHSNLQQQIQAPELIQADDQAQAIQAQVPDDQVKGLVHVNNPITDDELDSLLEDEMIPILRRSKRATVPIERLNIGLNGNKKIYAFKHAVHSARSEYLEALNNPYIVDSMRKEIKSLFDVGCISIVDLPPGRKAIGNRWVNKLKYGPDGEFLRAKSRICPWGFQQEPDIDYKIDEVSAPTLRMETATTLLAITAQRNMVDVLVDVDGAFQIPVNEQDVYMDFPKGFKRIPGKSIKLNHSMNGTKQAAYNWHKLADVLLQKKGLLPTLTDSCLYRRFKNGKLILVGLYVDDFRIAADDQNDLDELVSYFKASYPVKVQPSNWWLGMKIEHDRVKGILKVSQEQYILQMLEKFDMSDCKSASTPAIPNSKLIKTPEGDKDYDALKFPYREAVGSLLWAARTSRPDIMYAVGKVSSHCNNPSQSHVNAVKHILRYLKGTATLGMTFRRAPSLILEAMCDADWAGEPAENDNPMKSTSGIVVYLRDVGILYCESTLQSTIAGSTAEAEYKCLGTGGKLVESFRNLFEELQFPQAESTIIHEDNEACIVMANANFISSKMRHINLNHHYIRELIRDKKVISLKSCKSEDMVADIMTKSLVPATFLKLRERLLNGI
jgi:hypothetical protein